MLKHLSVSRMLDLSSPWLTHAKAVFLSIPEIAPLHPKLVRIHAELSRIRPGAVTQPPALRKILADIVALDVIHDALARAVFCGLQAERAYALAEVPPALPRVRQVERATKALFPKGLLVVNTSVLAETGHAIRTRALLERSPELRALLHDIPVRSHGTLQALTERWLAAGEKLGDLDNQRNDLEATHARKHVTKAEMNAARGRFIRLVSLVLGNLALSDAPKHAIETIRRPLLAASRKPRRKRTDDAAATDPTITSTLDAGTKPASIHQARRRKTTSSKPARKPRRSR